MLYIAMKMHGQGDHHRHHHALQIEAVAQVRGPSVTFPGVNRKVSPASKSGKSFSSLPPLWKSFSCLSRRLLRSFISLPSRLSSTLDADRTVFGLTRADEGAKAQILFVQFETPELFRLLDIVHDKGRKRYVGTMSNGKTFS